MTGGTSGGVSMSLATCAVGISFVSRTFSDIFVLVATTEERFFSVDEINARDFSWFLC